MARRKRWLRRRYREAVWKVGVAILLSALVVGGFLTVHMMTRDPNLYAPPPDN